MKLEQLSQYKAPIMFRPPVQVLEDQDLKVLGVCFPWGEMDLSEKVLENIRFYLDAFHNQSDATNPFGYDTSLSGLENALKAGLLLSNDVIYRLANKLSLVGGLELGIIARKGSEIAIAQVGQPSFYLLRGRHILPLVVGMDIVSENPSDGQFLPKRLVGIERRCSPQITSFQMQKGDELLIVAHSLPSEVIYKMEREKLVNLENLHQKLVEKMPQFPFVISKIKLSGGEK